MVFNNSKALTWILAAAALTGFASALDMKVEAPITCKSLPITVKFDKICTDEGICTFGESVPLEGSARYYGLVSQLELDEYTTVYSTIDLNLYVAGQKRTQNLLENAATPICPQLEPQADENDYVPHCPAQGEYRFDTTYRLPYLENGLAQWAASGWKGDIQWDMYLNSTYMIGSCTMDIETMVTGSYNKSPFKSTPSGRATIYGSLSALLALVGLGSLCFFCRRPEEEVDPKTFAMMPEDDEKTEVTDI